ncbi:MAG: DinB family protein [Chloroflexota bacterium]
MPTKELIQGGFAGVKRSLDRTLNTLTPAELKWQPCHDANSIQIILLHMARAEDTNVQSRLQKKAELWESEKWYEKLNRDAKDNGGHYTLEQVNTFSVSDTKDLLAYFEAVRSKTLEYLKELSEEGMERKFTMPAFGPPPAPGAPPRPPMELTVASMLLNTVTHLVQHIGESSYIRGLQRGMDK